MLPDVFAFVHRHDPRIQRIVYHAERISSSHYRLSWYSPSFNREMSDVYDLQSVHHYILSGDWIMEIQDETIADVCPPEDDIISDMDSIL